MNAESAHKEISRQLAAVLEGGRATFADVARALRSLASGGSIPPPFTGQTSERDLVVRLAWLLLARAPTLDSRYLILAPMSIELVAVGERAWADLLEEVRLLEDASTSPASTDNDYTTIMTLEADRLAEHIAMSIRNVRQDRAAMESAMREVTSVMSEALNPEDAQGFTERGTARVVAGDEEGALEDWTLALQQDPQFPLAYAKRASLWFRRGDSHRALADAITALVIAPPGWELAEETKTVLAAAEQAFARSDATPPEGQPLTENILLLLQSGANDTAIAVLDELTRRIPASARHLLFMRGLAHLHAGRRSEALSSFQRSLDIDDTQSDVWLRSGQLLLGERRNEDALQAFDRALLHRDADPRASSSLASWDLWEAHFGRGVSLAGLGRDAEGIDALKASALENPEHASTHCYIGICHDRMGQREASIEAYTRALDVDPKLAMAWFNRACEYAILGQRDAALADLERAAAIHPGWAKAATTDEYFHAYWDDPAFLALVAPHRA